jgi:hypothetical protein
MKTTALILCIALTSFCFKDYGQNISLELFPDSLISKAQKLVQMDSLKIATAINSLSKDSIHKQAHKIYYGDANTQFHIGWEDGKVPEFSNAYTLQRHELRLNVLGRSSYAITNRLEVSTYLPLFFMPNVSLKYRFYDNENFASAIEFGSARGALPLGAVTGLLFPGVAVGTGTVGLVHGSDHYVKLYASLHPSQRITFSVRAGVAALKVGYSGIIGVVAVGNDGVLAGVFPVNPKQRFTCFTGGTETDYVLNKKNVLVLSTTVVGFAGGKKQLLMPSLGWTHANTHFHYTLGLYSFIDIPTQPQFKNSQVPVGAFANVYWVFNNRIRK